MSKVLIIDDDPITCLIFTNVAQKLTPYVSSALTLADGLKKAEEMQADIIFLDVHLPDGNGLDALPQLKALNSQPAVVILTASGSEDGAEIAINSGAWDYLQKPITIKNIALALQRLMLYRDSQAKQERSVKALDLGHIVSNSPRMRQCLDLLAQAATCDVNVLITGETGTGKEIFARAIHDNSLRSHNEFVIVDCAALHETLATSILFGHVKGAFTGADKDSPGLIRQADKGSLFLDEIGELPISMQKNFLRVLQERTFRPVGSPEEATSDFRLIAATNRDLLQESENGHFREDLLYRLRSIVIELPPLRERTEDINELVVQYIGRICERYRLARKGFSPEFLATLTAYSWPGNIRELVHTLERAVINAQSEPLLFPQHLPRKIRIETTKSTLSLATPEPPESGTDISDAAEVPPYKEYRQQILDQAEEKYLRKLMAEAKGSMKNACKIAGLGRTRLYTLLKKHDISRLGWPTS